MSNIFYGLKRFIRKKTNSLLLILLTIVLSVAIIFSSLILETCNIYKAQNENPYSDYYRLMWDEFYYSKEYKDQPNVNIETMENFGYTDIDLMKSGTYKNIQTINDYFLNIVDYSMEMLAYSRSQTIEPCLPDWWTADDFFRLHGVIDSAALTDFLRGEKVLVAGRFINREDRENDNRVCMISDEVAKINDISVGDTINLIDPATLDATNMYGEYIDFTVAGIYHDYAVQDITNEISSYYINSNCIYVPLSLMEGRTFYNCYNYQIKPDNEKYIPKMEELINKYNLGSGRGYLVKVEDIYSTGDKEVNALESVFIIVQCSVIGFSALFMIVYLYSMITARKRECGILFSMGKTKSEVFLSIFIEYGLCLFIGVFLSAIITLLTEANISNAILNFIKDTSTVDSIRITTSDAISLIVKEKEHIMQIVEESAVVKCILSGVLIQIPIFTLGFISSAVAISKIKIMNLLTKEET